MEKNIIKLNIENINKDSIANIAVKSLIYEVSVSPKPGLVSRFSNGSHKDMNFYTFIDSALALRTYFSKCFEYGQNSYFYSEKFFNNLRLIGQEAEKEMYIATKNINTHKGTIFSMGILISVLSNYILEKKSANEENKNEVNLLVVSEKIKKISFPLKKELKKDKKILTHGEEVYEKFGLLGARGLAISGYDIVLLDGIRQLIFFSKMYSLEVSCMILLFYYISILDDTNIVSRSNIETLLEVKKISKNYYEKSCKTKNENDIIVFMDYLNKIFIEKNISAGGSADLLIITLFLYFLFDNQV